MPGAKARIRLDGADPINRGLVGFWPLNENAGQRFPEISPYRRNGTGVNDPPRRFLGNVRNVSFSGSNQYITVGTNLGLSTNSNITVAGWVYRATSGDKGAFFKIGNNTDATGGDGFAVGCGGTELENAGNQALILYEGNRWILTGYTVTVGWHHWVLTINNLGYPKVYIDGAQIYTDTGAAPAAIGSRGASIAQIGGYVSASSTNRYLVGSVFGVRVWSRALLPQEAQRLYRNPWAGTARRFANVPYNPQPPLSATITGAVDITGSATAAMALAASLSGTVDITASITAQMDAFGDTHDGLRRRSRRERRIEALRQRADAERLADAQALRLSLEAALGLAAEMPTDDAPRVAEAVQRAPKAADVDWRRITEDAEQYARLSRVVARLSAVVQAEARRRADDDDDDAAFLLGIA